MEVERRGELALSHGRCNCQQLFLLLIPKATFACTTCPWRSTSSRCWEYAKCDPHVHINDVFPFSDAESTLNFLFRVFCFEVSTYLREWHDVRPTVCTSTVFYISTLRSDRLNVQCCYGWECFCITFVITFVGDVIFIYSIFVRLSEVVFCIWVLLELSMRLFWPCKSTHTNCFPVMTLDSSEGKSKYGVFCVLWNLIS